MALQGSTVSKQTQKSDQRYGHSGRIQSEQMVPLASLLCREVKCKKIEKPVVRCGLAAQPKKGEDFAFIKTDCQRIPGDSSSTYGVFAVFDGHNGSSAALYSRDHLLNDVLSAIPAGLDRDEWLSVLPRALVAGFVKTDKEFQEKEQTSGTTATFVVVDGWTVTAASVGDSRCILDSQGGVISLLTVDHRLEVNEEERERITASGGEVGRLSTVGGAEILCRGGLYDFSQEHSFEVKIGPLRCWPGGLCLSRSIGDMDVGEFIVPIPFVKQIKLSSAGGRLIIASDGVWDSLSSDRAANCCRGLPAELAAKQIVKETLKSRGLRDDTTCLVVDLIPPDNSLPSSPPLKNKNNLMGGCFSRRRPREASAKVAEKFTEMGIEELFEEGSAMLAERLGSEPSIPGEEGLFICAICQKDITPSEGISVHAGAFFSTSSRPWEGPFLCAACKMKKDAMEGKRTSQGIEVV